MLYIYLIKHINSAILRLWRPYAELVKSRKNCGLGNSCELNTPGTITRMFSPYDWMKPNLHVLQGPCEQLDRMGKECALDCQWQHGCKMHFSTKDFFG